MEKLIEQLSKEQKDLYNKIGYFGDDLAEMEEQLANYLQLHCLTDDDGVTEEGKICESILDMIGEIE